MFQKNRNLNSLLVMDCGLFETGNRRVLLVWDFDGTLTEDKIPAYLKGAKSLGKMGTRNPYFLSRVVASAVREPQLSVGKAFFRELVRIALLEQLDIDFFVESSKCESCENVSDFILKLKSSAYQKGTELSIIVLTSGIEDVVRQSLWGVGVDFVCGSSFELDKNKKIVGMKTIVGSNEKVKIVSSLMRKNNFDKVICVGDGSTDIPLMRFLSKNKMCNILVHKNFDNMLTYVGLRKAGVLCRYAKRNYSIGGDLFRILDSEICENLPENKKEKRFYHEPI